MAFSVCLELDVSVSDVFVSETNYLKGVYFVLG